MTRMERRTIQIGKKELDAFFAEDPIDGFPLSVETHGGHSDKFGQRFYPTNLQGIRGESFPEGLDLAIYNVSRGFRYIDTIWVRKLNGACEVANSMAIDFHLWDMRESLGVFIDRYVQALRGSELGINVSTSKSEYGYYLTSTIPVAPSDEIYTRMQELEAVQESTYRKQLVPSETQAFSSYGEERRHWWIRYVVVPLLGSSALAAVLASYLLR